MKAAAPSLLPCIAACLIGGSMPALFAADRPSTPSASDPGGDPDADGLCNDLEALYGTIPIPPKGYDTDGDKIPDGEDGWALDADLSPPRLPEPSYLKIPISRLGIQLATSPAKNTLFDDGSFLAYKDGKLRQVKFQGATPQQGPLIQVIRTFEQGLTGLVGADSGGVFIETPDSAYSFRDALAYSHDRQAQAGVEGVRSNGIAVGSASEQSRSGGNPGSTRFLRAGVMWDAGGGVSPAILGGYHLSVDGDSTYIGDLFTPLCINELGMVAGYREDGAIHAPAIFEAGGITTLPSASPVSWWVPSAMPSDINSAVQPWIVGKDRRTSDSYTRAVLWSKVGGLWKQKFLSKHLFDDVLIPGDNHSINDRYEILGRASTGYEGCWVVRNGLYHSANNLAGAWDIYCMNNHGAMLARVEGEDCLLIPVEFTLHRRGTIAAPGTAISRPSDSSKVYEVVTLENADFDEQTSWVPNSMASAGETNRQDGATEAVDRDRDDDFVKIRLQCPAPRMQGSIELVMDKAGQGERMKTDDLRFYNAQGQRIQLADLKIENLQNPEGPLAPMLEQNGLDLFVEIADLGQITRSSGEANRNQRRYADLILKLNFGGQTTEIRARIYRGGYWRNQRGGNNGTVAFYDSKGRYQEDGQWKIDVGQLVHGPYAIKSGAGTTDETVRGRGPTPSGWYGLYERTDFRTTWEGRARPQTDHTKDRNGQSLGYLQQGSYCQWSGPGNYSGNPYRHQGANPPASIRFKFELVPWGHNANGRTVLQIHPDGWNDGTAGCVGLQSYEDCCRVFFLMRHYFGTSIRVETQ